MNSTAAPGVPGNPGLAPAPAVPNIQSWLWRPVLIVFVSNACIMILELVAGRIIAPFVGVSLYTWTSVIGVVLAGISLGNYLGGRLADRWASLQLLGMIFLLGGISCGLVLAVEKFGLSLPVGWPIVVQILVLTAALFFLPSMILGGVSPVVAKLAVRDLARTGSTLGRIYAAGTVGSIVGTFATGFLLISWFGTHTIVWGVAVVLTLMGASLIAADRGSQGARALLLPLVGGLLLAGAATGFAVSQGWLKSGCTRETDYFCIKVHDDVRAGVAVRILILDRLVHSYTALDDPTRLVYEYERIYAEATVYAAERVKAKDVHALFIGGGGYTFPKYMAAVYPGSKIDVVEIDPGVTQVAYDMLGLTSDQGIVSYNEDARMFLARPPTARYDLVMGDAFNDYSVPYHLTTKEFNDRVKIWLNDGGLYMVNMIDGPRHDFMRAYIHTLRQTFEHVYLIPGSKFWRNSPRMTYVLIATDTALDLDAFRTIYLRDNEQIIDSETLAPETPKGIIAEQMLAGAELDALMAEGQAVALTDRFAPVDQMLAPVFRGEHAPSN